MNYLIDSIEGIEKIKDHYTKSLFDEIVIEKSKIKNQGVFRWALKYAFWNLKVSGTLKIIDSSYKNLSKKKKKIDFWQTKREVFKTLKDDVKSISLDNEEIILQKNSDLKYINSGVSLGIVFSGSKDEEHMLFRCLDNILVSVLNSYNIDYEVLVCGPSDYQIDSLLEKYSTLKLRYVIYDNPMENGRFMIGKKKNHLYEQAKFNIVSILHTRILLNDLFLKTIISKKFDLLSPRVLAKEGDKMFDYISYHLISSYDLTASADTVLIAQHFHDKYLYFMKGRYPYIDGGICIFNKNSLNILPYNQHIAWGEAEDVESANRAYCNGYLLDYDPHLQCLSYTKKFILKPSLRKRIFIFLLLIKVGIVNAFN